MTRNWCNQTQCPALKNKVGNIAKITISRNTKRTYGKPNEQLSPIKVATQLPKPNNISSRHIEKKITSCSLVKEFIYIYIYISGNKIMS